MLCTNLGHISGAARPETFAHMITVEAGHTYRPHHRGKVIGAVIIAALAYPRLLV